MENENGEVQPSTAGEVDVPTITGNAFPNGFDGINAGGFPAMGMGGDFNQMQMMMAMQNGMGPGGFGNFPMMGMLTPI